jgi:tubulin polyglutamylase complex subunit 2
MALREPSARAQGELASVCATVVAHLEGVAGVRNVQLARRLSVSTSALLVWEREHYPAQLPAELKAFFEQSDGLSLTWAIEHMGDELALGCMHLNELKHLTRVDVDPMEVRVGSGPSLDGGGSQGLMAFDLDSTAHDGRLCLLYRLPAVDSPQVWFLDLSRNWYFIAESFADYFRLLLLHLGLPRWHYAFTDVGLDPAARGWIRLLAPHRLHAHAEMGAGARIPSPPDRLRSAQFSRTSRTVRHQPESLT